MEAYSQHKIYSSFTVSKLFYVVSGITQDYLLKLQPPDSDWFYFLPMSSTITRNVKKRRSDKEEEGYLTSASSEPLHVLKVLYASQN